MHNIVPNYKTIHENDLMVNSPKKELKTENKYLKQRNILVERLYKIQELVNTQSNDMLLGEAVRKLFF
jgi:hypothetical protein